MRWKFECVNVWMRGCVDVWKCECVIVWMRECADGVIIASIIYTCEHRRNCIWERHTCGWTFSRFRNFTPVVSSSLSNCFYVYAVAIRYCILCLSIEHLRNCIWERHTCGWTSSRFHNFTSVVSSSLSIPCMSTWPQRMASLFLLSTSHRAKHGETEAKGAEITAS